MATTKGQHLIGKVLGGCVLEQLLGYGGSSAVFLAQQSNPLRKVAVKVFLPRAHLDPQTQQDFYTRFVHEAEAASQLHHPHLLPIYSFGEQDGLPYIVMPYMPGGTLAEHIARNGPLSLQEAARYLAQIASALDYAHQHGCVHCDVKPANILLDSEGQARLSDFGIARIVREEADATDGERIKESLMGTPDYISPEQALGQPLDGRSDVYSLGVTMFYLLAKQLPFRADSTIALALLHVHEPPPSLALLRVDVMPAVDRVIQKALDKDPSQRFQSAGDFSSAFSRAVIQQEAGEDAPVEDEEHRPLLLASKPVVSVKPLARRSVPSLARVLGVIALAFVLPSAVAFSTGVVSSHLFKGERHEKKQVRQTVTPTAIDILANHTEWPISNTFFFENHDEQRYHILNTSSQGAALALYADHEFRDFRLVVTMTEIRKLNADGDAYYGIIFRSTTNQSQYYLFEISTADGGQYVFSRLNDDNHDAKPWQTLTAGPAPSLFTAPGKSNTIVIEARGNSFSFIINNTPVGFPVDDPSASPLMTGEIGLYVEEQGVEVAFSHLFIQPIR